MHAGHKVLMEVDNNILLISIDPQWILDQQLRPHLIHFKKIVIILINYIIIKDLLAQIDQIY
jgi:hypothetical protein